MSGASAGERGAGFLPLGPRSHGAECSGPRALGEEWGLAINQGDPEHPHGVRSPRAVGEGGCDYAAGMWGVGRREEDPHRVTWMEKTMRLRVRIWGNLGVPRSLFCENHPETVAFLY